MHSLLDKFISFFESNFAGESLTATEELLFNESIEKVDIIGRNGSITWLPLGEGEQSKIVLEKEVWGNNEDAMRDYLVDLTVENESSPTQIRLM